MAMGFGGQVVARGRVVLSADTKDAKQGLRDVEQQAGRTGKALSTGLKIGAAGAVAGIALLGNELKKSVDAAKEAEVSQRKMETQLKALGISYDKHAKHIDTVIQKQSKLAAVDDEELQDSFTNLVRVTGDVNKALELNALAADIARAKNIDLQTASTLVGKVAAGNTGVLGRYGIQIEKGATATEALGLLQEKFAGQAKAYGESNAGAADRVSIAVENLHEKIGEKLLPILSRIADYISENIPRLEPLVDLVADAFGRMKESATLVLGPLQSMIKAIGGNETAMKILGAAFKIAITIMFPVPALVKGIRAAFDALRNAADFLRDRIVSVFNRIKDAIGSAATWVRDKASAIAGFIKGIPGELGDVGSRMWGKLRQGWEEIRSFVADKVGRVVDLITGIPGRLGNVGSRIGNAITGGIKAAWNAFAGWWNSHNSISFKGVDLPGPIPDIPGFTISLPDLPTARSGLRITTGSTATADDVLIRASRGEVVVPADAVNRMGPDFWRWLGIPGFAAGGVVGVAQSQLGVKEVPDGSNSGPGVNDYLASVSLGPGNPWCAAFTYWTFNRAGLGGKVPRSGLVNDWYVFAGRPDTAAYITNNPGPGDLFLRNQQTPTTEDDHIGIVTGGGGGSYSTIEGNHGNRVGYGNVTKSGAYAFMRVPGAGTAPDGWNPDEHDKWLVSKGKYESQVNQGKAFKWGLYYWGQAIGHGEASFKKWWKFKHEGTLEGYAAWEKQHPAAAWLLTHDKPKPAPQPAQPAGGGSAQSTSGGGGGGSAIPEDTTPEMNETTQAQVDAFIAGGGWVAGINAPTAAEFAVMVGAAKKDKDNRTAQEKALFEKYADWRSAQKAAGVEWWKQQYPSLGIAVVAPIADQPAPPPPPPPLGEELGGDTGGGGAIGGGTGGGGGEGGGGPTAEEIQAQIDAAVQAQAEAVWSARQGFYTEFASNVFTPTPAGLTLGSQPIGGVTVVQQFNRPPDDQFSLLRRAEFAASAVFGR